MKMKNIAALVAAMAVSAVSLIALPASADELPSSYTFYFGGAFAGLDFHKANRVPVTVTADGSYSATLPGAGITSETDLILYLDSDVNIYAYGKEEGDDGLKNGTIQLSIDSVQVDGIDIAYSQSANAVTTGDNGHDLRANIYNSWGGVTDIDPNLEVKEGITVNFTVSGLFPVAEPDPTDAPTEAATTAAPADSTTAAGSTTTAAGSTTTAAGGTTTAAATTTNAATGDTGIAVAVAALAVAGGMVLVSRKNK